MKLIRIARLVCLLAALLPGRVDAHIGSPNVFFQGQAGPYPVHIVIRPAEVVPGLAEISVRVGAEGIERVTALPIKWNAGRQGAPPPDVAVPVPGETNLYNAQLWFMEGGSQSVEVEVTGKQGAGRVTVPVDAVARRVLTMPKSLGAILGGAGALLVLLLLSIVGAAVRESVLQPGLQPTARRRIGARVAMAVGLVVLTLLLWGGQRWWNAEAADYRNNRLYQPISAVAEVRPENPGRRLRLEITDSRFARSAPLVPDHGKLMHMFLVREPGLDAFAHVHPVKRDRKTFEAALPPLPAGSYRVYADITYETGFSDTVTTSVDVPELTPDAAAAAAKVEPDDSWAAAPKYGALMGREFPLGSGLRMTWIAPDKLVQNEPVQLRFKVTDAGGQPVSLEPYLGMRGHLALRKVDGTVFTHLHPGGTASMASMQLSTLRSDGKLPLKAAFGADEPICEVPEPGPAEQQWLSGPVSNDPSTVAFPYAFPKPGPYRLWVQVKVGGEILTGAFDLDAGQ